MSFDLLPKKRYYSIGEVAKAFAVKPSLLRFWEGEFDTLRPKKNKKGTRKYTPENVQLIQFIYHLVKEKGMTLAGAKKHLKQMGKPEAKILLLDKLKGIRAELQEIKDQL